MDLVQHKYGPGPMLAWTNLDLVQHEYGPGPA